MKKNKLILSILTIVVFIIGNCLLFAVTTNGAWTMLGIWAVIISGVSAYKLGDKK